jgi:hypothetical protein
MVLAHKRPWLLPLIVKQVKHEWPDGVVQITVDRPSSDVVSTIAEIQKKYPDVDVFEAPIPAIAERENFMELRNFQLEKIRQRGVEFAAMWDDDHIIESPGELEKYMQAGYDLVYISKLFLWDHLNLYNEAIPDHHSVFFFRVLENDKFPLDRIIHAPVMVHDNPLARIAHVSTRLLDIGYLFSEERERVFTAYKRAGKIDPATLSLVNTPQLREYRAHRNLPYWYTELRNAKHNVCNTPKSTTY